jgi:signal transduction histidine kinase
LEIIGDKDKIITINISEDEENRYQLVDIIDNGIGIPEGNLSKIVCYGFNTKKNGKGFDLHTSALAISEFNGKISANSGGGNKGAKFSVIVPINSTAMKDY